MPARRGSGIAAILAAAALSALAIAALLWPHPGAFKYGNEVGLPMRVGETAAIGMGGAHRQVDIRAATAVVHPEDPMTMTAVAVCRNDMAVGRIGAVILEPDTTGSLLPRGSDATSAVPEVSCDEAAPAVGARVGDVGRGSRGDEYLVLLVTPLQPGTVTIEGVELRYRSRWRDRVERSGVQAVIEVSA